VCHDVQILYMRDILGERSELVEMRGKQTKCANLSCDVSVTQGSMNKRKSGSKSKKTYSDMAQANPKPSYVEVPRPSSSMIINESFVADYAMSATYRN
jgi:hypothetical protein